MPTTRPEPEGVQTKRWPLAWRLIFILAAALACWAPILLAVWFFFLH